VKLERLLALRGQPPSVDATEAEAVALELYDARARAFPLDGERDRNFRLQTSDGRQLVLKFIDHEADDVIVSGQSAVLAHLAEQDAKLPVPRVIATRAGEQVGLAPIGGARPAGGSHVAAAGCRVRLATYLPGAPIWSATRAPHTLNSSLLQSVGQRVGQLDRALAGFFHPALAQPIAWDVRQAPSLLPIVPLIESRMAREVVGVALEPIDTLLRKMRGLRSQAIHGDCHPRNLLVGEDRDSCVGIIDLGDMIHAPLALEIAVTMAEFLADGAASLDALSELLAGYTSIQPLEHADIAVLYDMITARITIGVLIQTWRERNQVNGATASGDLEALSIRALNELASRGRDRLTAQWHDAARTAVNVHSAGRGSGDKPLSDLLRRRRNTLGANAELSYDRPLHLVRGEGVWVYTADGERFLDVYNNVPHVGHAHPDVVAAIANQAKRIASNTRYLDEKIIEYVERLTATLPPDLNACLFVNSGSEANDIAWRIAKSHTAHAGALVMNFAYHGITDAVTALSPAICPEVPTHVEQLAAPAGSIRGNVTGDPEADDNRASALATAAEVDANSAIARLAARGFAPAALMIDSALTSTGIFDPPPSWIAPIVASVRKAGGLIIGDEVQFGLGRSGSDFWGFARRGYHPDIVTLGKPVGNGYPLGVVITRREILEEFQRRTGFFSTFGGNPVAGAAGLAVLDVLRREHLVENARTTGDYFIKRLRELVAGCEIVSEVRGRGLLVGVEVKDRSLTKRLVNRMRDRGVLIGSEGPRGNVLKLRPPMPFRPEHADIVVDALRSALSAD
jgi:4-aminobutyrate aminotransferase-like enzyme/Ser/Thr protein kinase RdoA (MazF antagonist)